MCRRQRQTEEDGKQDRSSRGVGVGAGERHYINPSRPGTLRHPTAAVGGPVFMARGLLRAGWGGIRSPWQCGDRSKGPWAVLSKWDTPVQAGGGRWRSGSGSETARLSAQLATGWTFTSMSPLSNLGEGNWGGAPAQWDVACRMVQVPSLASPDKPGKDGKT